MSKTSVKRNQKERLFREQRGLCYYCEKPMLLRHGPMLRRPPNTLATLDHVIPRAEGGAFAPSTNAVAACWHCNNQRGAKDARLFMLEKQGALA